MSGQNLHIGVLCDPRSFHTQKWCTALAKTGATVTVFSFWEGQIPGVACVKLAPPATRRGEVTYLSYLLAGRQLRKALRQHGVNVVNPINATPFGVWAWCAGVAPVALVTMGSDILEYPPQYQDRGFGAERRWESASAVANPLKDRLRYVAFRWLVGKALHHAAYITGDNEVLTHAVRDWFSVPEASIVLNRWGVEPELFAVSEAEKAALQAKYGILPGQTVILSPRGMKPIYQGDIILEAFERLLHGLPDAQRAGVRCIMLSAGYVVPDDIRQRADALQQAYPQSFVYVPGVLPREEVLHLWALTEVFVNAPVYDGYSNALAEGRYAGAIPVVNDTPATREVLVSGEHAVFVAPFTPENLAAVLNQTLQRLPALHARMVPANRAWIETHSMMDVSIRAFAEACRKLR